MLTNLLNLFSRHSNGQRRTGQRRPPTLPAFAETPAALEGLIATEIMAMDAVVGRKVRARLSADAATPSAHGVRNQTVSPIPGRLALTQWLSSHPD